MSEKTIIHFDDGNWYAASLGEFVGLLIDAGQDVATCFRVIEDASTNENKEFVRKIEFYLIPNGEVINVIKKVKPKGIHKVLRNLLEAHVVK